MTLQTWVILGSAYLLGSIPFAYLVTRLVARADIRNLGDGNVGAKNTFLSVGRGAGLLVGAADVGKGMLAVLMARSLNLTETQVMLAGACAVLGHDFSLFLHFRGGQGMAAMIGAFAVLFPRETMIAAGVLALVLLLTRNWDLSCGIGLALLPVLLWLGGQPPRRVLYPIFMLPTIGLKKLMAVREARKATA